MAELIEIQMPDGEIALAEVSIMDKDVGTLDRFNISDISTSAARIGGAIHQAIQRGMPGRPHRIGIDIGLKLVVKSGVLTSVLAEASGEASIVIRLDWDAHREPE
jgi:hypothetical protein